MNGRERSAGANVEIWNLAVVEPDGDEPRIVRTPLPHQPYGLGELFILVANAAVYAGAGETGDENGGAVGDRVPNIPSPVVARRDIRDVSPNGYGRRLKGALQAIRVGGILADIRDECMTRGTVEPVHERTSYGYPEAAGKWAKERRSGPFEIRILSF